jgi:hypothetical protein
MDKWIIELLLKHTILNKDVCEYIVNINRKQFNYHADKISKIIELQYYCNNIPCGISNLYNPFVLKRGYKVKNELVIPSQELYCKLYKYSEQYYFLILLDDDGSFYWDRWYKLKPE